MKARRAALRVCLGILLLALMLVRAEAADSFQPGDRVQYQGLNGAWEPAVVVQGLPNGQYGVALDVLVGSGVPDYAAPPDKLRRLTDGSGPPPRPVFPRQRPMIDVPVQEDADAGPPPEGLLRRIIQSDAERSGGDDVVNVDVEFVRIGRPKPWDPTREGPANPASTAAYPVTAIMVVRAFNGEAYVHREKGLYDCFVDGARHWRCSPIGSRALSSIAVIAPPDRPNGGLPASESQ